MTITTTDQTDDTAPWAEAGEAWGHAAVDWATLFEPYARDAVEDLFSTMGVGPGVDLLDVACGSGLAVARAERLGARVAGIDVSAPLVTIAERRAPGADLRLGSMFDLPWSDGSFDAVTSFNGVWGGGDDAIAEAARVLRPGGRLGVTFWGPGRTLDLRDFFIVVGTTGPDMAEELIGLARIGEPGVAEAMFEGAGLLVEQRAATLAVIEWPDDETAWRALRSPGAVVPSLRHTGEAEMRRRVLASIEPFRAPDGSYRLVNRLEHLIGRRTHESGAAR